MTNEMESGNEEFETRLSTYLNKVDELTRLFENEAPPEDINKYIRMNTEEMRRYDAEACLEISLLLTQYTIFLQRVINRESAMLKTCYSQIYRTACKHWGNYDKYAPKELKLSYIAGEDFKVKSLLNTVAKSESLLCELDGLVNLIKSCSDIWKEMGKLKNYGSRH